ncbi:Maf family nucleotide pyrophosphatase [Flavobacterium sp. TSSA_36]|jgi:septum formation protein|uniref:Maf family nucleotide pyrophosphatase n=1 Tax=Flavobacterium sp. TSSA_36 TaxID=3447669 RepID=UPI003F3ED95D
MLKNKLAAFHIILASGSPRRQQFFVDLDINFEIRLKEIEEVFPEHLQGKEITEYLSVLKAQAFENELEENELLITSDTLVWHHEKALGKPKNYKEAFEMLSSLSNTTHEVITSVCFKTKNKTDVISAITKVTFTTLNDAAITYYLEKYEPYDKAGAYGIQEWIGFIGVKKIEGSYTNVMGLPTEKVFEYLNNL